MGTKRKMQSKFLSVKCNDCENEQVIFDHASTSVKCNVCGSTLVESRGGKAELKSEIIEVFE